MLVHESPEPLGRFLDGNVDGHELSCRLFVVALVGAIKPPRYMDGLETGLAFGAQAAKVGGMLFVAAETDNPVVIHLHEDAATHPAIGANALDYLAHSEMAGLAESITENFLSMLR